MTTDFALYDTSNMVSFPKTSSSPKHPSAYRNCDPDNTNLHVDVELWEFLEHQHTSPDTLELVTADLVSKIEGLFLKLTNQLHLNVTSANTSGRTRMICAKAGSRTRQVLFGSALLEVTQTVQIVENDNGFNTIRIRLHWYHPSLDRSRWTLQGGKKGYHKRARFIQLFNAAWRKMMMVYEMLPAAAGLSSDNLAPAMRHTSGRKRSIHNLNGNPSVPDSPTAVNEQAANTADDDEHHEVASLKLQRFSTSTTTLDQPRMRKVVSAPAAFNRAGEPATLRSSLKRRSLDQPRSARPLSVSFSAQHLCAEVPVSVEEREARMGPGERATFDGGVMKPLRSSRTGSLIWLDNLGSYNIKNTANLSLSTDSSGMDVDDGLQKRLRRA